MKINKIKEALSKLIAETFERVSTDKGILALDGALDDIEVGMGVSYVNEEGEEVAAEDGDYILEDGRILKIAEGKIAEIREKEEEQVEETVEESPEKVGFMKQKCEFEESYDEKTRKIADAIRSLGFDAWVVEAADDYAVVEVWADGGVKHYRFAISWDEAGNPIVGEMTEVEQEYVPVEEEKPAEPVVEEAPAEEAFEEVENPSNEGEETDTEAVVKLREEVNELYNLVDALTKRIEELEKKPAAEPASQEFRKTKIDKFSAAKDAHSSFLADLMKA